MVQFVPFLSGEISANRALIYALLFVPVGAATAILATTLRQPARPLGTATLLGAGFAISIEMLQLLSRTHVADATQAVLGTIGVFAGAWLLVRWGVRHPIWSPLPVASPQLRRVRAAAMLGSSAVLLVLLWLAARQN
jgi:glycopeptide antibiotics resistance protein